MLFCRMLCFLVGYCFIWLRMLCSRAFLACYRGGNLWRYRYKRMGIPFFVYVYMFVFFTASWFKMWDGVALAQSLHVVVIVNRNNVITNYDIDRRTALLRLQKREGDINTLARKELINEMLCYTEMKNKNISVSESEIDAAFTTFSESNHMTAAQLTELLIQADVTIEHFRSYIYSQIGCGRLISKRLQEIGEVSQEEAVQRMLKNGGIKPSSKDYLLYQVIFVVPRDHRTKLLKERMYEANILRKHIDNCETIEEKIKGMVDVSIRNLGHVLELQLPESWKNRVLSTEVNRATSVLLTEHGAEFLVVCSIRNVSNDRVAQLFFSMEKYSSFLRDLPKLEKTYMQELQRKAKIQFLR